MRLQRLTPADITVLDNPGVRSEQLIWPHNAPAATVTMTRVTMQPGATTPLHAHPGSEQVWVVQQGTATLLLVAGETSAVQAGDIIRTPPGEAHGLTNSGTEPFVYLTATTPPINLTASYQTTARPGETAQ